MDLSDFGHVPLWHKFIRALGSCQRAQVTFASGVSSRTQARAAAPPSPNMKIRLSSTEILFAVLAAAVVVYLYAAWDSRFLMKLRAWFPLRENVEETKAVAPALTPLAKQIPLCRKERSGFQACMFKAGYAVNSAWTAAHNDDHEAAAVRLDPARAGEVLGDQYRAGQSPIYGVPYWVPRK